MINFNNYAIFECLFFIWGLIFIITRVRGQKSCILFYWLKTFENFLTTGKYKPVFPVVKKSNVLIECKQTFCEHFLWGKEFLKMRMKGKNNELYGRTLYLSIIHGFIWFFLILLINIYCTKGQLFIKFEFKYSWFSDKSRWTSLLLFCQVSSSVLI